MSYPTFLPEWVPQQAVMLAWPHASTDWAPWLNEIDACYVGLVRAIAQAATPLILYQNADHLAHIRKLIGELSGNAPIYLECAYDDTWCRDYGPLTIGEMPAAPDADAKASACRMLDFQFSGWGDKFAASQDNAVNQHLRARGVWKLPLETIEIELEGGSVESDGEGTLMTTTACLLGGNRNEALPRGALEDLLREKFGVERILWIENGHLCGDDTDSHIDNLVRFASTDTLMYAACDRVDDEHFQPLQAMYHELTELRTKEGATYRLLPLYIPEALFDENGKRLPASYANFLIVNRHIIVPQFDSPYDSKALEQIALAFPDYTLLPISGKALIKQYGGPHCATMQLPCGSV
ncbi:Peptidylarginine deiminase-related protein [gamma proteobacterium HdN1]|nr:Peptidylarginine deiminase-related protein [gamma proteobacterium HdN1]